MTMQSTTTAGSRPAPPRNEGAARSLDAPNDPRQVIADPHARYFGAELKERTLIPRKGASLAETRFEDWLNRATAQLEI